MKKVEAFLVTGVIALLFFPFLLIFSIIGFIMEIYFNIHELFSNSVGWEKALVTKFWQGYIATIKECYNKIVNE